MILGFRGLKSQLGTWLHVMRSGYMGSVRTHTCQVRQWPIAGPACGTGEALRVACDGHIDDVTCSLMGCISLQPKERRPTVVGGRGVVLLHALRVECWSCYHRHYHYFITLRINTKGQRSEWAKAYLCHTPYLVMARCLGTGTRYCHYRLHSCSENT
jgi:hypothetical protein